MGNFLQEHYNRYRDHGGDHAEYVVYNDISREVGEKLRITYEARNQFGQKSYESK
jgi:hypothetical protein